MVGRHNCLGRDKNGFSGEQVDERFFMSCELGSSHGDLKCWFILLSVLH